MVINLAIYYGKINIPENKHEYYILDTRTIEVSNTCISELLQDIYLIKKNNYVEVIIEETLNNQSIYEYNNKWKTLVVAKGNLHLDKMNGVYDWVIGGEVNKFYLGEYLFNNTGKSCRISIKTNRTKTKKQKETDDG